MIATPAVLDVIESARRSAFEQTALGYYNATRYLYDEMFLKGETQDINFTFKDGEQVSSNPNYKLEVNGEKPKGGLIYLTSDGQIMVSISNNKYCANVHNGEVSLTDNLADCSSEITVIPERCFTIKNEPLKNAYNYLDGSEEWMTRNYNVLYYNLEDETCPRENINTLVLPSEVNGQKVEGLASSMFNFYEIDRDIDMQINQLIIPEGVLILQDSALVEKGLRDIILPESLIYLGYGSVDFNELTSVKIPSNVKIIGGSAFAVCKLKHVEFSNGIKKILQGAFANNQLTNIEIPDSVTTIGNKAFISNELTSVNIPDSVTHIGSYAFAANQLTSVVLSNSITTIEDHAFSENQLASIEIPENIVSIGEGAFRYNKLTSVIIPNSVTTMGRDAFNDNPISEVTIGNGMKTVENVYGNAIEKLTIGQDAGGNITVRGFVACAIRELVLGPSVTNITKGSFKANQLPDEQAFIYKRNSDGTDDKTTLVSYGGAKLDNIVIPNTVREIGDDAFLSLMLTSITIPSSVRNIGENSFSNTDLKEVTFEEGVETIGRGAFAETSIVDLHLPNSLITIGEEAFAGTTTIANLHLPNNLITIGAGAFLDSKLTSITIPASVQTIGIEAFAYNEFPDASAITVLGDATRFYSIWEDIGFPIF